MNAESTIQYNSLSWVKDQLDVVLADAQGSLSDYIENNEDTSSLQQCVDHLRLVFGTLQMVEIYGAAMLAEEMQKTAQALLEGEADKAEDVYDILMRSMLQLPDYLEGLQGGNTDSSLVLLPLMNDLRAARKESLLSESVLFLPELESVKIEGVEVLEGVSEGQLQSEAKRLRTHYQLGLLDLIKNSKGQAGIQRMLAVIRSLEKSSFNISVKNFWVAVSAFIETTLFETAEVGMSEKMIFGAIDRQLKVLIDTDEASFSNSIPDELYKNILFYVGRSKSENDHVKKVKQAYKLDELLPAELTAEAPSSGMGGLNTELFISVSDGIKDDLTQVKDVLEIFIHSENPDATSLEPLVEQLVRIGDTYGMLGLGGSRTKTIEQSTVIDSIVKGETEVSEDVVMKIADELLSAESELNDYIAQRSGLIDSKMIAGEDNIIPTAEYRNVISTVVGEGLSNFTFAKESILSFISGIGDKEQLDNTVQRLEEVRGIALMLSVPQVEAQVTGLKNYVQLALIDNNHIPDEQEQESVADLVTCIEYFLESMVEGRLGVEAGLVAGDKAAQYLADASEQYQGVTTAEIDIEAPETETPTPAAEVNEIEAIAAVESKPAVAASGEHEEFIILADDADEEILEIFIEEAVEVLEAMNESYPQWKSNTDNEEALTVVRRSFHTLKGSGRLIGAHLIGEFAWKFESMLNRLIDKQIVITDHLFNCMDEALAVIPQLIEQLKGNREPISNIYSLMHSADVISEGGVPEVPVFDEFALVEHDDDKQDEGISFESSEVIEEPVAEFSEDESIDIEVSDDVAAIDFSEIEPGEAEKTTQTDDDYIVSLSDSDDIVEPDGTAADEDILDLSDMEATELDEYDLGLGDEEVAEPDEDVLGLSDMEVTESESDTDVLDLSEMTDSESDEIVLDLSEIEDSDDVLGVSDATNLDELSTDEISADAAIDNEDVVDLDTLEKDEGDIEVVIAEGDDSAESLTSMDPVLFNIYYEESTGRLKFVEEVLRDHDSGAQQLTANKDLIRAFHTLYGSARTAEIEEIAELCGATEKYVKAREEAEDSTIPDEVVSVIKDVIATTSSMIEGIKSGIPQKPDIVLLERINVALQDELQAQLQDSIEISETEAPSDEVDEMPEVVEASVSEVEEKPKQEAEILIVSPAYAEIDEDLIDIFIEEAEELLESCDASIIALEANAEDKEASLVLQRDMHTLKGGARMAELKPVGDLTHVLESLMIELENGKVEADKRLFDLIHQSIDNLTDMISSVRDRKDLNYAVSLVPNIEALLRGEEIEQRAVERFDVAIDDLEESDELEEDIVIPEEEIASVEKTIIESEQVKESAELATEERRPGWGERASDVNYKESQDQVRVRADLLNELVNSAGEVNIFHARMGKQVTDIGFNLSELEQTTIRLREQLRSLEIETEIQIRSSHEKESDRYEEDFDPLEMDRYSTIQQLSRSLGETASDVQSIKDIMSDIVRDSETLLLQESRVSTELQEGLMRTRMVRFGGLSSRMRRIVRQTARELGKEVELEIYGDNIEVDRKVLDNIVAPLEHMLRNAVAHGIESAEKRLASGKSETGKITIIIDRTGSEIIIKVKDDGAGMNANAIRAKAIEKGLLDKDSDLGDQDVLQFILKAGFSTAESVSQIAGRGVGMDVVDSEIKQLGGLLEIETAIGKGSEFVITLPVTLAINQALLVSANEDIYAIPLSSIEGVVRITGHELQSFYDSDQRAYEFNGVEYELKHMGNLMTGKQGNYANQYQLFPVLLAKVGEHYFALHVDDLIERREVVVKPVGHQLGMVRGISGATILADGRVVLIIEMAALVVGDTLFRSVSDDVEEPVAPVKEVDREKVIMIVDDSITIRKVTSRMLERNGISVVMAKDGVDATTQLQETIPDLMLLDIEMPRMDGFELATYMRNDDKLKDIPIIMITSRTGEKHKEKAFAIGVNEFLGKPYQEEELMKNINKILSA